MERTTSDRFEGRSRTVPDTSPRSANLRRSAALAVATVLVVLAALVAVLVHRARSGPDVACPFDRHLVPACGALLGVEPPEPSSAGLDAAEESLGHPAGLVYSFHDIDDVVPSAFDRQVVASGRVLHVDIDSRDYSDPDPTTVPWAAVASGAYDQDLERTARGIASLHAPVFVTFDHEPDQPARAAVGTPAEFVAAWRHVHDLFVQQGATNAVWVWVVMALPQTYAATPSFWPGDAYVDWVSWDSYDEAGCRDGGADPAKRQSFRTATMGYLTWLRAHPGSGIDLGKPMMISETGTVVRPANGSPTWYDEVPDLLRAEPGIKAVTVWDHTGSDPACDFRLSLSPTLARSAARAAADPWFAGHVALRSP
jgi:hypothetical protein